MPTALRTALRVNWRDSGIALAVVALFVVLAIASPAFLTARNLQNILDQSATLGIVAAAGTLVIIAGGFDLSTGAIFALAGVLSAKLAVAGQLELGILAGVAAGVVVGVVNGGIINAFKVNSFMATLASGMAIRGITLLITSGFLITVSDPDFAKLGNSELFGLRLPVFIFAVVVVALSVTLTRTTFGRRVMAVGGNEEAARLAGISVNRIKLATFAISGGAAGLAGVIAASRISTGQANVGATLEFSAIVAVVVGGTSIHGGQGAVWRTVLGVLFLAMITNAFTLLEINPFYEGIVQGVLIVAAIAFDALSRRGSR